MAVTSDRRVRVSLGREQREVIADWLIVAGAVALFASLFLTWSHQFSPAFLAAWGTSDALRGVPHDPTAWQVYASADVLLTLFWGQKAGGGLLLGLVIGQGFRMMAAMLEADSPGRLAAAAAQVPETALLVMAWVTVRLLDRVEAYGLQLLRVQRVGLIAAMVVVCLLAIFYRAWSGRSRPSRSRC